MENFYSLELNEKLKEIENKYYKDISIFEADIVLKMLFQESNIKIKTDIHPSYESYFPTKKHFDNWEADLLFGSNHMLSGGVALRKALLWNSSYNFYNSNNDIMNKNSSTFVIDLNGDIFNLVDLTKAHSDRNPITNTVGVTYVNVGLLKKNNNNFYWHGGSKNNWKLEYPYAKKLIPKFINSNLYYQPISREQLKSSLILSKILLAFFMSNYNPYLGDKYFKEMVNISDFLDSLYNNNYNILNNHPSFF